MPTVPTGIPSVGYWTAKLVTTIADTAAPKLATEVNAASSVAAECIFGKGWGGPSASYEKTKNERFCTIQSYERLGKLTYSIDDFVFAADPQSGAGSTALNKVWDLVKDGWSGYLVLRIGKSVDTAAAVGDKVWVLPIEVGVAVPMVGADNEDQMAKCAVSVISEVKRNVALVA